MPKISVQAGSTGVSVNLFFQASTATDGAGLTGLKFNAAGFSAYSIRQRTTATPITLATSTVGNPWITGGFIEVDATNAKGWYNFDIPNAVLATGSPFASVNFQGAAAQAQLPLEIELTAWNNQDATAGGINNLLSGGTLGSVSNVRGTATVILAAGTHAGAVIPVVQTASNVITGSPTVAQITTGVWAAFGTGVVQLNTGTHTGAIIPQVNVVQTSADGRMANLDLNVGAVGTIANAIGVLVTGIISTLGTSGVVVTTGAMISMADAYLDRNMALGPDNSGTGTGPRTPRQGFRALRNHWQVGTDGVYTSFKEDDSTISFAKSVISTNSANLITGLS